MKLPQKIKDHIYELVLAPLLRKPMFAKSPTRDVVLRVSNEHAENKDDDDLNYYRTVNNIIREKTLDPDVRKKCEKEKQELDALDLIVPHPFRAEYQKYFPYLSPGRWRQGIRKSSTSLDSHYQKSFEYQLPNSTGTGHARRKSKYPKYNSLIELIHECDHL